ncbi:MAG: tyrosine--tRNA ligase [Euryarchaeota archaeon]|nr:tyrosine--tRNA ligase [Euryarchaeota archaeon]
MKDSEAMEILERNVEEIVTRAELETALASEDKLRAYVGFEPSGVVHIGHLPLINKLRELQRIGFHVIVLLADMHAYLNEKGSLEDIRDTADYNKRCFTAAGLSDETEYIFGASFQMQEDYMLNVLKLATVTTEKRARRSMDELSRSKEDRKVSQLIYPLMQAIDIASLGIDVAVGGIDQRKIHMLARENLPKLGFKAPICIHTPLLIGLDGEKMSSSLGNFISVHEPAEDVERKLKAAFCTPEVADGNPVLQIYKHTIFPVVEEILIERPAKYGGDMNYKRYEDLEQDYTGGQLHPLDVKTTAARYLNEILAPIRSRL